MKRIEEIDLNMAVTTCLNDPEVEWLDPHDAPFVLNGFAEPQPKGEPFRRLPKDVAEATNEGVASLALNTAGGRVRFKTDSPYVAVHAEMANICRMDHMAFTGIYGFDLYQHIDENEVYIGTFRPSVAMEHGFESKLMLHGEGMKEITINFPLYNGVDRLFIGVKEGSEIAAPRQYAHPVPVVYYGSSITQGGCASRPGNSYQAMITRMLDCDHINLGFSGSARAEETIVNYMAGLTMSVFVCDYDHNAPTVEHLKKTHLPLYRAIRKAQPELPIILITKPDHQFEAETEERRKIILNTYNTAIAEGDTHIAFIDGATLFEGEMADSCTVDTCHPNDLGFYRMSRKIGAVVKEMLK